MATKHLQKPVMTDDIRAGTDVEAWKRAFQRNLFYILGRFPATASMNDKYLALAYSARDCILDRAFVRILRSTPENHRLQFAKRIEHARHHIAARQTGVGNQQRSANAQRAEAVAELAHRSEVKLYRRQVVNRRHRIAATRQPAPSACCRS